MQLSNFYEMSNFEKIRKSDNINNYNLFCVSHCDPIFVVPTSFCLISASVSDVHDSIHLADDALGPDFDGFFLSEYSQHFSIIKLHPKLITTCQNAYFFQYRKFLSFRKTSTIANNARWIHITNAYQAPELFPTLDELKSQQGTILIGPVIRSKQSLCSDYGQSHHIEDFCTFATALGEVQGFTRQKIKRFINDTYMLPSPTLCSVPTSLHLHLMSVLQNVWEVFFDGFYIKRDGYQRRVGGFLLERLHGHLLLEYLRNKSYNFKSLNFIGISDKNTLDPSL